MTLYHHQRSVKSDDHSKRMKQIKTKDDLQKRLRDFGEVSVCQALKFREIFYLVNFSKNYLVNSKFI